MGLSDAIAARILAYQVECSKQGQRPHYALFGIASAIALSPEPIGLRPLARATGMTDQGALNLLEVGKAIGVITEVRVGKRPKYVIPITLNSVERSPDSQRSTELHSELSVESNAQLSRALPDPIAQVSLAPELSVEAGTAVATRRRQRKGSSSPEAKSTEKSKTRSATQTDRSPDPLWDALACLTLVELKTYGASRFGQQVKFLRDAGAAGGDLIAPERGEYLGVLDGPMLTDFAGYWHTQDWRGRDGKEPGRPPAPQEVAGEFRKFLAWRKRLTNGNGHARAPADERVAVQEADAFLRDLDLAERQLEDDDATGTEASDDRMGTGMGRDVEAPALDVPELEASGGRLRVVR
jgi:hypothetical protein